MPADLKPPQSPPSTHSRGTLRRWIGFGAAGILAVLLLGFYAVPWVMPMPADLERAARSRAPDSPAHHTPTSNKIPSSAGPEPSVPPFADLPKPFVQIIVATQDPGFWDHGGTDTRRIAGAVADGVRSGHLRSGASTITEQLAKMTSGRTTGRSVTTRLADALTARRIELSLTKQQILEEYSARLPFGNGYTGLTAAAAGYFGKSPANLTLAETALLAALPDAPSRLNPYNHFADAKSRQISLLNTLAATGQITAQEAQRAAEEPLALQPAVEAR